MRSPGWEVSSRSAPPVRCPCSRTATSRSQRPPATSRTSRSGGRPRSAATSAPAPARSRRGATCRRRCSPSTPAFARREPTASAPSPSPTSSPATATGSCSTSAYDDVPRSTGYAAALRPHAHHYTILAACAVKDAAGIRVAVTGAAPTGVRCPSVEAAVSGGAPASEAAACVLEDVDPADDALASAWYRRRTLPTLVERALSTLA